MTLSKILCETRAFCIRNNASNRFRTNLISSIIAACVVFPAVFQYSAADSKVLFRALAVQGSVMLRHNNQQQIPLRAGQTIVDGDELYIASGAFTGLVASNGSSVELKRPGRYKAGDLAKQYAGSKQSGVASKFADYVAAQMTSKAPEESNDKNYKTKMESTGSVERAVNEQIDVIETVITLADGKEEKKEMPLENNIQRMTAVMPRSGKIIGDKLTFSWLPESGTTKYKVHIRDSEHKAILEQNVENSNNCVINLKPLHLKNDECYFWSVRPDEKNDDYRSDEYAICLMTKEEQKLIADTLKQLTSELGSLKTATSQLVLAAFYEQNELFASADACYIEAKRLAPDIEDIKEAARRFRARIEAPTE